MEFIKTLVIFAFTLSILVGIHEWGHFFVARRCGVKVLTFSIGFGRTVWCWISPSTGTCYQFALIPLGGYVKMLDEREGEVPAALKDQAFNRKPVWQRITIVAAGPLVNLIFAVGLYWFLFVFGITAAKPTVMAIQENSPAAQAQIEVGGEITHINQQLVRSWQEVNLALMAQNAQELKVKLYYSKSEQTKEYQVPVSGTVFLATEKEPIDNLGLIPWRPKILLVVGYLDAEGVAAQAGMQLGDKILAVDNELLVDWSDLVERIKQAKDKKLNFVLERQGQELLFSVLPKQKFNKQGQTVGYLGLAPRLDVWPEDQKNIIRLSAYDALFAAYEKTEQMINLTLNAIWKMLEGVISVKNLSGPISIAKVASTSAEIGIESFISFLAYLSISLGVLNLLPIPMLDGGHLLYYIYEVARGKPLNEKIQILGLRVGIAIVLSLMIIAIFNDLLRFLF